MSADWWLSLRGRDDAEVIVGEWNLTYNLGPMIREAGWPTWDVLKQGKAADLGEMVGHVVATMEAEPERFRALNPPNGWGDYDGCLAELRSFLRAIEQWPAAELGAWL